MQKELLTKVKVLIQNNQLSNAAKLLLGELNIGSNYYNEMLMYCADIKNLERMQRIGIESVNSLRRENNRITNSILQLINELENEPEKQKKQVVYISYAWEKDSEQIAESFELAANEAGLNIVRDKSNGLLYKGNIEEYMQLLSRAEYIVVILSDQYLKSHNCMYEILKIKERQNLSERVFPIILPGATIYDPVKRTGYIKYWQKKWKDLNASLKSLEDLSAIEKSQKDLKVTTDIKNAINEIVDIFANINSLSIDVHVKNNFRSIIEEIQKSLKVKN